MMEVEVYGRLTNIACNPGDKLRLICFELTPDEETAWLRSTTHSNMQVSALGEHSPSQGSCFQGIILKLSAAIA